MNSDFASISLWDLLLLIVLVLSSCFLSTLFVFSWLTPSAPVYSYCSRCRENLQYHVPPPLGRDAVVGRKANIPPYINCGESATFRRLGMGCSRPRDLEIETSHLEDGGPPISPVEIGLKNDVEAPGRTDVNAPKNRENNNLPSNIHVGGEEKRIRAAKYDSITPETIENNTGKKSMISQSSKRSKRTLFQSQSFSPLTSNDENLLVMKSPVKLSERRKVRRSLSERKETSGYTIVRREQQGLTSQSEDERSERRYLVKGGQGNDIKLDTSYTEGTSCEGEVTVLVNDNKGCISHRQSEMKIFHSDVVEALNRIPGSTNILSPDEGNPVGGKKPRSKEIEFYKYVPSRVDPLQVSALTRLDPSIGSPRPGYENIPSVPPNRPSSGQSSAMWDNYYSSPYVNNS